MSMYMDVPVTCTQEHLNTCNEHANPCPAVLAEHIHEVHMARLPCRSIKSLVVSIMWYILQ